MDRRMKQSYRQTETRHGRARADVGKWRIFYEIYPDLRWQPAYSSADWFEVALHAQMSEYRPPNHPSSREAIFALVEVADFLMQKVNAPAPCSMSRSSPYFTIHPPASGDFAQTMLSRTVSLVFSNVGSYTQFQKPSLLNEIENHLSHRNIFRFQRSPETICR